MLERRRDLDLSKFRAFGSASNWSVSSAIAAMKPGRCSGWARGTVSDSTSCRELLQAAVASFRRLRDPLGLTWWLVNLSATHLSREELSYQFRAVCEEAAALAHAHELWAPLGAALADLGTLRLREADIESHATCLPRRQTSNAHPVTATTCVERSRSWGSSSSWMVASTRPMNACVMRFSYGLEQHGRVGAIHIEALVGVAKLCLLRGAGPVRSRRLFLVATGSDKTVASWSLGCPPRRQPRRRCMKSRPTL